MVVDLGKLSASTPSIVLGVFVVLLWLARRLYERDLFKKAMRLAEGGEHREALGLLMRAEEVWALNEAHSTPKTITKDFRRLTEIVAAIQSHVHKLGGELDTEEITKAIGVYINVYSNKKSLVFGTHRLKASARSEIDHVSKVLPVLRGRLRATCQDFYKMSSSRPLSGLHTYNRTSGAQFWARDFEGSQPGTALSPGMSPTRVEQQPRGTGLRVVYFVGAVLCLLGIMPVAIVTWQLLPPGVYPVILAGLPALPLLWLSTVFFRRSGLRLEEFARREPTLFKAALYVVFGALAVGFLVILDHLGLL